MHLEQDMKNSEQLQDMLAESLTRLLVYIVIALNSYNKPKNTFIYYTLSLLLWLIMLILNKDIFAATDLTFDNFALC